MSDRAAAWFDIFIFSFYEQLMGFPSTHQNSSSLSHGEHVQALKNIPSPAKMGRLQNGITWSCDIICPNNAAASLGLINLLSPPAAN